MAGAIDGLTGIAIARAIKSDDSPKQMRFVETFRDISGTLRREIEKKARRGPDPRTVAILKARSS